MFIIEDEIHAEPSGSFATIREAFEELKRRAAIPWDQPPNLAPCTGWRNCGREYVVIECVIVETEDGPRDWDELNRTEALKIGASGIEWLIDPDDSRFG